MNQVDGMIFQSENFIKEHGDKISEEKKTEIEHDIDALKNAHEENDVDACKVCMDLLQKAMTAAGTEVYSKQFGDGNPLG